MFLGFGPVARGLQMSLNLGAMLVLFMVQALFSLGRHAFTLADGAVFLGLVFVTFQQSRMLRKGLQVTADAVSVRTHWFEPRVALSQASAVVIPHGAKPVKVVAADGGYASAALALTFLDPPQDKAVRDAARARVDALLSEEGVLVTAEPFTWATGTHRESDQMRRRVIAWTLTDTAWSVPVFLAWLALVLL